jgi:2-succinyl-5-enolpyruvyl-6-hydroxy-3-cyclohexene-1-carboxylate synthase
VLLNNDGGGIFSFLPQADNPEHFELLFGTPHGLDFAPFVAGYGGDFVRVADWQDLRDGLAAALGTPGLHVLEVPTQRGRNVELHRAAWRATFDARRAVAAVG